MASNNQFGQTAITILVCRYTLFYISIKFISIIRVENLNKINICKSIISTLDVPPSKKIVVLFSIIIFFSNKVINTVWSIITKEVF